MAPLRKRADSAAMRTSAASASAKPAPAAGPFYGGDHGLRQRTHGGDQPREGLLCLKSALDRQGALVAPGLRRVHQVEARAEAATRTRDHHDPTLGVVAERCQGRTELGEECRTYGVQRLGAVQGAQPDPGCGRLDP